MPCSCYCHSTSAKVTPCEVLLYYHWRGHDTDTTHTTADGPLGDFVAACVMGFITIGTRSTVSSFLKTIIADLGTNRETISFVVATNIWLSGFLQPFAGYILDRCGARGLFTVSIALYGLGIGLIGLTHSVWYLFVVYGGLVGAASAGASMSLANALVAQWFRDWRAFAMGIKNAGGAVGTLFLVGTMIPWLLSTFGWRLS